jgi:ATP-binding cassette subfamily F protein 3
LLAGREALTSGEYVLGHNVEMDYFAQDQYKELDPGARVLDDLESVAPRSTMTELRTLLGCFLFSEDDVFKPIGVLSGGERNRYALARMLLQPANFLLLDEPTNHLDMRAKDVLLEALMEYNGTVVFVSHDRYFIDKLATKVFEVGGGAINIFAGNYEDYLWRKNAGDRVVEPLPAEDEATQESSSAPRKGAEKRLNPIKLRQMKERQQEIEEQVARLEAEIAECETALASFRNIEETRRQTEALDVYRSGLETLLAEWEQLGATLETHDKNS